MDFSVVGLNSELVECWRAGAAVEGKWTVDQVRQEKHVSAMDAYLVQEREMLVEWHVETSVGSSPSLTEMLMPVGAPLGLVRRKAFGLYAPTMDGPSPQCPAGEIVALDR